MPRTKKDPHRGPARPQAGRKAVRVKATKHYTYTIVIHPADPDETGYWVEVPALPGCFTQGESVEECVENARDAITGYLASLRKHDEPIPVEAEDPRLCSGWTLSWVKERILNSYRNGLATRRRAGKEAEKAPGASGK